VTTEITTTRRRGKNTNTHDRAGVMTSPTRALIGAMFLNQSINQSVSKVFFFVAICGGRARSNPCSVVILFNHIPRVYRAQCRMCICVSKPTMSDDGRLKPTRRTDGRDDGRNVDGARVSTSRFVRARRRIAIHNRINWGLYLRAGDRKIDCIELELNFDKRFVVRKPER